MVANSYTFQESVEYLLSLGNEVSAMKLGLENITTLLAALGDPHKNYLKVQVAGTNGKGSVCAFLDSICRTAGIRTGLYTSPHLISITERIKIAGEDIEERVFAELAEKVRSTAESLVAEGKLEYTPTFFEQITAIALLAFADAKVELAILETGLGGRLDATTAANAEIAAITRIDYDHQEYLGETIEEIAAEKAAIIGSWTRKVILGEQAQPALNILLDRCRQFGLIPDSAHKRFPPPAPGINIGLRGTHQIENAFTAVMISGVLSMDFDLHISEDDVRTGLERTTHPGRLESIGNILLDGAHNPGGAAALRAYLDEFVDKPIVLIFGAMADKNVAEIGRVLFPAAETLILTVPANSRALSVDDLEKFLPANFDRRNIHRTENVASAISQARKLAGAERLVLVTGSLYLVGEARKLILELEQDPD